MGSRPVCGVDGKDYPNLCELSKSSCHANRLIEVKFQGVCGKSLVNFINDPFQWYNGRTNARSFGRNFASVP